MLFYVSWRGISEADDELIAAVHAALELQTRTLHSSPTRRPGHSADAVMALQSEGVFYLRKHGMDEDTLLRRITVNPAIFGGKPVVRGRRLAVEHVLGMLAAGDTPDTLLSAYPWLEREDVQACLAYAHRVVGHERVEPLLETGT